MAEYQIYNENNLETLKRVADNSLDAVVTDAPYGLGREPNALDLIKAWAETGYLEIKGRGFMGKEWDAFVPQPAFWKEVYRVLKPGGYVLCFFGTRTYDWGTLAIRLAGFEIRDCVQWIYGSGFPKSLDVSKAIDKAGERQSLFTPFANHFKECRIKNGLSQKDIAVCFPSKTGGITGCVHNWENGLNIPTSEQWAILQPLLGLSNEYLPLIERIEAEREIIGHRDRGFIPGGNKVYGKYSGDTRITAAATELAKTWEGYGTALKPAHEPICVARKPLDGTVAENVLKHQCGAINLDGCRIPGRERTDYGLKNAVRVNENVYGKDGGSADFDSTKGRFPSNIIIDEEVAAILDEQSGESGGDKRVFKISHQAPGQNGIYGKYGGNELSPCYNDFGGASRFFYCAKASRADRDYGCEWVEYKEGGLKSNTSGQHITRRDGFIPSPLRNNHPTVKPINLIRYLVRLVKTPFNTCTIADFFMGSGTTGVGSMLEGINFIGCEMETESYDIAYARIEYAKQEYLKEQAKPKQTSLF